MWVDYEVNKYYKLKLLKLKAMCNYVELANVRNKLKSMRNDLVNVVEELLL